MDDPQYIIEQRRPDAFNVAKSAGAALKAPRFKLIGFDDIELGTASNYLIRA